MNWQIDYGTYSILTVWLNADKEKDHKCSNAMMTGFLDLSFVSIRMKVISTCVIFYVASTIFIQFTVFQYVLLHNFTKTPGFCSAGS